MNALSEDCYLVFKLVAHVVEPDPLLLRMVKYNWKRLSFSSFSWTGSKNNRNSNVSQCVGR